MSEVQTESVTLAVPEMDCPTCAGKVTSSVRKLPGITEVSPRTASGRVVVSYDPTETDRGAIEERVRKAGYAVVGGSEAPDDGEAAALAPAGAVWTSREALLLWAAAAFLAAGLAIGFLLTELDVAVAAVLDYPITVADIALLVATGLAAGPVLRNGYYSARNLNLDIDLLMGAAILGATAVGLFEEAATLAVLFGIAELLEDYAMDRARNSLRELVDLSPDQATMRRDGVEETVPVDAVGVGDVVLVRPGERIPVDGEVIEGSSAVDEAPITGESVPVEKAPGDEVFAGTIAAEGYLEVRATATAGESTIARVIELVEDAEAKKTRREQFVDRFAAVYTPVVVALAVLTMVLPPVALGADPLLWFVRGLTLLVISCPCAFVISTPVSVVSAITSAAKNGVLIKGGSHLEAMGDVDVVALDKTGTLTTGELAVTDVVPVGGREEAAVLRIGAALEGRSEHPIAGAIVERARTAGVEPPEPADFEALAGRGVRGTLDGTTYFAGSAALFAERGLALDGDHATNGGRALSAAEGETEASTAELLESLQAEGKTTVLVGTAEEIVGVIGVADQVRPGAERTVARLQEAGLRVVMLTGDTERTAAAIAEAVGVDAFRADLLPAAKVAAVEALSAEDGEVAMVGDGINDAPALAAADVGIAMGAAGTDTAIETADIALLGDDLGKLPYLYSLSHKANAVIRENIWSSLGVKFLLALGVPLGYVGVALAVLVGDMGMSLGVTGNALRLSRIRPD